MNNEEVHIIKIGEIIRGFYEHEPPKILVDETTDINRYYVNILRDHLKDFSIMKTSGIIRQPTMSKYNTFIGLSDHPLIGYPDGDPVVGKPYTINNSSWSGGFEVWHTSMVNMIIDGNILLTKNSVYALHNQSLFRDRQLKLIGI